MNALQQAAQLDIDPIALMNIIVRSTEVHDSDSLLKLINNDVFAVLGQDVMVCGVGGVTAKGSYAHKVLHHNYPPEYFDDLATADGRVDSPLMQRWRATQEPVIFQSGRDEAEFPGEWLNIFNKYQLRNTIAHGVLDVHRTLASYFIFSRIPREVGKREVFLLKMITPHLHLALLRALTTVQEFGRLAGPTHEPLSDRQKQILRWLHEGKTNWEIAQILEITEKNVKYHVEQIFTKLEVRNRTQAVGKALLLGLLS
jgi:transcriptional regulator EpsA